MISDVLSEAVSEVDRYLCSLDFAGVYGNPGEPLFDRIVELRDEMEAMRKWLDDPHPPQLTQGSDLVAIAETKATLFLVGLAKRETREERIAHAAYVCGFLHGNEHEMKGEA